MTTADLLGFIVGMIIGLTFGWLQLRARRRNDALIEKQGLPNLPRRIPGSMVRIALLLIALVIAQIIFQGANIVWMAVGVAISYAIPHALYLKEKYSRKP
jgi:hypothetical protein